MANLDVKIRWQIRRRRGRTLLRVVTFARA